MNGLGFVQPWMLVALPVVGLPVLIHFLTRARPARIAFPPIKFLMEACAGQQALHRLRTILLLVLRCLAVLGLVLVFARPFLKAPRVQTNPLAAQRVVLIVDASLSMRAVEQGVTLFARAQVEAGEVLRGLASDSSAAVILAGATPRPLLPALSRNFSALHEMLGKAEPTYERGDPTAALALAKRLLGEGPGTVYTFSDFQQTEWENVGPWPAGLSCKLRPVTEENLANVAVTQVRVTPAAPVLGESMEAVCSVFNSSSRPRQETVRFELGDLAYEQQVSLAPYAHGEAVFELSFPQAAVLHGSASVRADNLIEDNQRYVSVRVQQALDVLLVTDSETNDARSAAFFVSRALAPSSEVAPGFNLIRRYSQETDRGILETADLFVLVSPLRLSGEALEIISRRVKDSAWLIAFLDEPTGPQLVPPELDPPFQLVRPYIAPAGEPLVPGLRPIFPEGAAADWAGVRIRRYYQNVVSDDRAAEVLLSYPDGSAALTLSPAGQGAVVFVNMALTIEAGGDLLGSPLFPSLMQELVRALRGGARSSDSLIGDVWTLESPAVDPGAVTVRDPEDQPVEAEMIASGRTLRLALPKARRPGVYQVRSGAKLIGAGAANVDARESDLRRLALERMVRDSAAEVSVLTEESELATVEAERPLWPHVTAAVAACFGLEMLLLCWWRPGPGRRGVA